MTTVFADAGYWLALWRPRDALHERAMAVAESMGTTAVVTTQLVLTEALDAMAGAGEFHRQLAVQMVRELEQDPDVEIIPQTDAQFRASVERYAARPDQRWSLTDYASFLVMEERGLTEALAYDRTSNRQVSSPSSGGKHSQPYAGPGSPRSPAASLMKSVSRVWTSAATSRREWPPPSRMTRRFGWRARS